MAIIEVAKGIKTHLQHGVASLKELDETGNNTALDNTLDRGVLLLRQELAELGGRVKLALRIVRENARNHLLSELKPATSQRLPQSPL